MIHPKLTLTRWFAGAVLALSAAGVLAAQQLSPQVRTAYVKVDAPVIALTNARVIDGTGGPVRQAQTIVIRDGVIAAMGDAPGVTAPDGATIIDLAGKTVLPGFVMVHEHLYYPVGSGVYGQLGESFTRLYLAGGVTTMRTGGNVNGFMDLNMKLAIDRGQKPGPTIDATAPYLNGPNNFIQMRTMKGPDDARRQVAYWADEGFTSFKAYMQITRAELGAAIDEAHKRGMKITGHLCSVTYAEAADLGIDNLEHGFLASTDFVPSKAPDACPGQGAGQQAIAALDEQGEPFRALVKKLVDRRVALTSTLTVFETYTPGRPKPPGLEVLLPILKEQFDRIVRTDEHQHDVHLRTTVSEGAGARARVRQSRRAAHRGNRPDRIRRRDSGLFQPAADRAAGRSWLHAGRGRADRHVEWREVPRPGHAHRHDRRRQAGRSRGRHRRSVDDDRGYPERRHRLQARRRVRSGEARGIGQRPRGSLVSCQGHLKKKQT